MNGATKAAIILLAAERSKSLELLRLLSPEELQSISHGAERLGQVDASMLASTIASFEDSFNEGLNFIGSHAEVRNLITEALRDEPITAAIAGTSQPFASDDPWPAMKALPLEELRTFILLQHPQVGAFIMTNLDSETNAELLAQVDVDACADLMMRMLSTKRPADSIVWAVEEVLAKEFIKENSAAHGQAHADLAAVLNRLDPDRANNVMGKLQSNRPADAKAVGRMLFRFEDLPKLSPVALTAAIEAIAVDQIVVALKGADPALQAAVLGVMSARTKRMAESEMQNGAAINQRTLLAARQSVVETVLRLAASGAIELTAENGASEIT
jgi:flagellar motor switch protein FliG